MEQNKLFIIVMNQSGVNLDPILFITYNAAYAKLKELYDEKLSSGIEYDVTETKLMDWGFTISDNRGYLRANILQAPNPGVLIGLPDGRFFHALSKGDNDDYPGIKICVLDNNLEPDDGGAGAVWMEYDQASDNISDNQRMRILAWNADSADKYDDEGMPVLILRYDTGEILNN